MKDITVIIPILNKDLPSEELKNAVKSVAECQKNYTKGNIKTLIVTEANAKGFDYPVFDEGVNVEYLTNDSGATDFCSQINYAVDRVNTEYFSILEFDDEYKPKWFKFAEQYHYGNEDVSIFLPINVVKDVEGQHWQYANEMALATSATDECGFIDMELLEMWTGFNLTGAIFNTEDFKKIGKYKPSIKIAFNYELMLRMADKKMKMFVVPKEGYIHKIGRDDSLTAQYNKEIPAEEIKLWFDLAKREHTYDHDRNKGIIKSKNVKLS